ncbi:MAG TPA: hypothetical protein VE954_31915 [Oligoflexus sp.]|uniref:hypothetical protein n=1 Tax=Oligoflexus sp. TaxID=1971216 RepID=UPI002D38FCBD|nr:hypothetical protein [Oligoflexus sp.]HYX37732.1 hypothetical protein [Oligoflexus sp.]
MREKSFQIPTSPSAAYLRLVESDQSWLEGMVNLDPMQAVGFKTFMSAAKTVAGIEMIVMIKKGQIDIQGLAPFEHFCALAG